MFEAVLTILQAKKNLSRAGAEALLKDLQSAKRYVQELWTA